ncbi:MAG: dimethyladenosine transferase [Cyanobacteriota bacterium]|jgi:16S rRNA (adenine1518-N6/adenine1519-N6)-dimethyltransferase
MNSELANNFHSDGERHLPGVQQKMTFRPRKRFGQHWLNHPPTLQAIIQAANISPVDRLLEIGPGMGVLTRELLTRDNPLVAVELDRDLCIKLKNKLTPTENFLLLEGDILKLNLPELLTPYPQFRPINKVVANIPYNITGPILALLLGSINQPRSPKFDNIVLLVQKEIAERLTAQPGSKAYGALSVRMQYLARIDWIVEVSRRAFTPPPQVDSAVVRIIPHALNHPGCDPRILHQLVHLGFANRRKMLRNNLKGVVAPEQLMSFLEQLSLPATARAEEVSLEQWLALSNCLAPLLSP